MRNLLTVTDVVEYAFCKKFTYYTHVLGLKQYEEKRGTVMAGRKIHESYERTNRTYIPYALRNARKYINIQLHSSRLGLTGKADEVLELSKTLILIERKYSEGRVIHDTQRTQIGLLALLLEENLGKPVTKAIIIFLKGEKTRIEIQIDEKIKSFALEMLAGARKVIDSGTSPVENYDARCGNCCFRKICPVGSLNTKG